MDATPGGGRAGAGEVHASNNKRWLHTALLRVQCNSRRQLVIIQHLSELQEGTWCDLGLIEIMKKKKKIVPVIFFFYVADQSGFTWLLFLQLRQYGINVLRVHAGVD